MANILILSSCAYIFHWSHNNYSFNRDWYERKKEFRARLEPLHDVSDSLRTFPYKLSENGTPIININGLEIDCNDMMLKSISGDFKRCNIINGKTFKTQAEMLDGINGNKWHFWLNSDILHNKFNSLGLLCFPDGLGYYRLHFKHGYFCFVVSGGKLYHRCDILTECQIKDIYRNLGVISTEAKRDIKEVIDNLIK